MPPRQSHTSRQHLANVIGAFVTAYADELRRQLEEEAGGVHVAVAALHTWPDRSVEFLAAVLELTHSGAVRLIDRLVTEGLATRKPGADRRSVALQLTAKGNALARRVRETRYGLLLEVVDELRPYERETIEHAFDRLLRGVPRTRTAARHACRLCDHTVCRGDACPIGASVPEPA